MVGDPWGLPRVLLADASDDSVAWLTQILSGRCEIHRARTSAQAIAIIQGVRPHVLIVGSRLDDVKADALLALVGDSPLGADLVTMCIADSRRGLTLAEEDSLFYVIDRKMSAEDVQAIVASAVTGRHSGGRDPTPAEAARIQRLLEVPRRFALQRDLNSAARVATSAALEFLGAERAECLFYDPAKGLLWCEGEGEEKYQGGREMTARFGLAGFAARTRQAVHAEVARNDPRYRKDIDDPRGTGDERIIAQPLIGLDGLVHCVLVAVRLGSSPPFSDEERNVLAWLASQLGPSTGQLALHLETQSVLEEAAENKESIFRREAVDANAMYKRGDVVRVSPHWIRWAYWLVVVALAGALGFSLFAQVSEYSTGPALIFHSGRADVTSPVAGSVVSVLVKPGDDVKAGQVLAQLYSPDETSQLDRLDAEWQSRLRDYLAAPANLEARSALGSLRAERDRALERLTVRATAGGKIADVLITVGQTVVPEQKLMSLDRGGGELTVVALLPGGDRPQLRPGMTLRLSLAGYRDAQKDFPVDTVSAEAIGPAEAERTLGAQLSGSVQVAGAVVVVRARIPDPTFTADGETYEYHHGMQGLAEVRLRRRSVLATLLPENGAL